MTKFSHSTFAQQTVRMQKPALAALAAALLLIQGAAFAREVQLKVNNLVPVRLKPNDTTVTPSQNGQSVAYFANNTVGQSNRRTLQVRLAEPFLCADFSPAGVSVDRLRLRLVQSNGDIQGSDVRGFGGLQNLVPGTANVADAGGIRYSYDPSNANLSLLKISTDTLVCYDLSADVLFSDGFESINRNTAIVSSAGDGTAQRGAEVDLSTSIRTPAGALLSSARPGAALEYVITVTNNGSSPANSVQVRDYFPKRTNAANGNPNGAAFDSGSWLCTAAGGASCGTASGSDYVFLSNATIPASGSLRISVNRNLSNSPILPAGTQFSLQAAAFVAPSESEIVTNNNALSIPVTAVTNSAPTVVILSNPTQTRGACPIGGANTCLMSVTVGDDSTLPVNIGFGAVSTNANLEIDETSAPSNAPTERRIRYQLATTFSGQAIVNATATDANGASTTLPITVTVTDPPPSITDVANITRDEDNGATGDASAIMVIGPIAVTIGGVGVNVNTAQLEAVSADTAVIPQSAIVLGGSGANRTVTITVPRHAFNALSASVGAPSNITLTVRNGSASASDDFNVRLIAVNDPPVLRVLAERSFTGPITNLTGSIPDWLLEKSTGAANEANPPAGSGVVAQSLADAVILNPPQQTTPAILSASVSPSFSSSNPNTLQFRWLASPQSAGAACVFAEVSEVDSGQAGGALFTQTTGKIRMNSGDISCGAPPLRTASK
jgi:uncharacterized repeat protein (TIGR01451 family)